jgi:hypothetical protein
VNDYEIEDLDLQTSTPMGYSEFYCLACGGPCVEISMEYLEERYEEVETKHEKTKIKKIMNRLNLINTSWVEDCVVVTEKGTYRGTLDDDYPCCIEKLSPIGSTSTENIPENIWCMADQNVYAFHSACWKLINQPTYGDLQLLDLDRRSYENTVADKSVYPLSDMMAQEFVAEIERIKPSQLIHLIDPSKNEESALHVLATWEKVKKVKKPIAAVN